MWILLTEHKYLFIILLILNTSTLFSQNLINPSFDSVYIGGIDRIHDWIPASSNSLTSSLDTVRALEPDSCYQWLDPMLLFPVDLIYNQAYNGFGIRLSNTSLVKEDGQPFETYIVNGSQLKTGSDGYPAFEKLGEPFPYRPSTLLGWYKYLDTIPQTVDHGRCMVLLKKYNPLTNQSDTIAYGQQLLDTAANWSQFQVPLNYRSAAVPDSIVVVFIASTNPTEYGELWLDELDFDFTSNTIEKPNDVAAYPTIYPNPNAGVINIKEEYNFTSYKLIAIDGRELRRGDFSSRISVEDISLKTFILQLTDDKGLVRAFQIIKH